MAADNIFEDKVVERKAHNVERWAYFSLCGTRFMICDNNSIAPAVMKISARLNIGQNRRLMKSMTQPKYTRSIMLENAPEIIRSKTKD